MVIILFDILECFVGEQYVDILSLGGGSLFGAGDYNIRNLACTIYVTAVSGYT